MAVMIGTITINIITSRAGVEIKYGKPSVLIIFFVSKNEFGLIPLSWSFSVLWASLKENTYIAIASTTNTIASTPSIIKMIDLSSLLPPWAKDLSLIHISEPTRPRFGSRMPSSA